MTKRICVVAGSIALVTLTDRYSAWSMLYGLSTRQAIILILGAVVGICYLINKFIQK